MEEPSYLKLYRDGELEARIEKGLALMESCHLCPRECDVNRLDGETGYCRTGRRARVASYNAHFGEEAPLVGNRGSGTIFFSSCNLLCSFCQNYDISHLNEGVEVEPVQIGAMMIELKEKGCHNINFVTPTHTVVQILEALIPAIEQGLNLPLVYNSGGYESVETLALLDGIFDIYMPDFKFWEDRWAERLCKAPDYRERAKAAIKEMHRQVGDLVMDRRNIARRGLLIRHLVLPGGIAGSREVIDFIANRISPKTYLNIMDQYHPAYRAGEYRQLKRRGCRYEVDEIIDYSQKRGLKRVIY